MLKFAKPFDGSGNVTVGCGLPSFTRK